MDPWWNVSSLCRPHQSGLIWWLKDFDPLVLEYLEEELLDFELKDFFGKAADGLAEPGGGGGGVMSADVEGMGVDTEVVTVVLCRVPSVVTSSNVGPASAEVVTASGVVT